MVILIVNLQKKYINNKPLNSTIKTLLQDFDIRSNRHRPTRN